MVHKRLLLSLYVFSFFKWFAPIWAVEKLFMQHQGLQLQGISVVLTVWMVAMLVCEVPTGIIADRYSRKWILVFATCLSVVHFFLSSISHSLAGFVLSWALYAPSLSLVSGTLESYLHDVLTEQGQEAHFAKYWARSSGLTAAGSGIAIGIGGFLASSSYQLAYQASIAAMVLATIATLFLPSTKAYVHEGARPGMVGHVKAGFGIIRTNSVLRLAVLYGVCMVATATTYDEYQELFLSYAHIPLPVIGMFAAAIGVSLGLVSCVAHRLFAPISLPGFALVASLSLIGMALSKGWVAAVFSVPFLMAVALGEVLADSSVQQEASKAHRATIASLVNAGKQSSIVLVLLFAQISQRLSMSWAVAMLACFGVLFLCVSRVREK
jgi:MFS family permease